MQTFTLFCLFASILSLVPNVLGGMFFRDINKAAEHNNEIEARSAMADFGMIFGDKVKLKARDTTVYITVTAPCTAPSGSTVTLFTTIPETTTTTMSTTATSTESILTPSITNVPFTSFPIITSTIPVPTTSSPEAPLVTTFPPVVPTSTIETSTVEISSAISPPTITALSTSKSPTPTPTTSTTIVVSTSSTFIPPAPTGAAYHVKNDFIGMAVGIGLAVVVAAV